MTNDERPAYPRAGQGRVPFPGSSMPNGPGPSRGQRRDNTNTPHNGGYRLPSRDFMGGRGDGEIRVLQQRAEPRLPTASTLGVKVSAKASGSIQATKAAPTSTGSKPQTSTVVRPSQRNAQPSARPRASSLSSGRLLKASGAQAWTTSPWLQHPPPSARYFKRSRRRRTRPRTCLLAGRLLRPPRAGPRRKARWCRRTAHRARLNHQSVAWLVKLFAPRPTSLM